MPSHELAGFLRLLENEIQLIALCIGGSDRLTQDTARLYRDIFAVSSDASGCAVYGRVGTKCSGDTGKCGQEFFHDALLQ